VHKFESNAVTDSDRHGYSDRDCDGYRYANGFGDTGNHN
jgi:hypothetical protein